MVSPILTGIAGALAGLGIGVFTKPTETKTITYAPQITETKTETIQYSPSLAYAPQVSITYPSYAIQIHSPLASISQQQQPKLEANPKIETKPIQTAPTEIKPTQEVKPSVGLGFNELLILAVVVVGGLIIYGVVSK